MSDSERTDLIDLLIEKTKAGKLKWTSGEDGYWPLVAGFASVRIEISAPPNFLTVYAKGRRCVPLDLSVELINLAARSRDAWAEEAVEHALVCLERL